MGATILVIEDEKNISDILEYGLTKEGFNVLCAYTGGEGYRMIETENPSLVLLDVMLPDMSGINICNMIRDKYTVPVIMLTALSSINDRLQGLDAGADDYITKPFDIREVVARIKTVLRRTGNVAEQPEPNDDNEVSRNIQIIDDVRIEFDRYIVYKADRRLELTPKEFELLSYLVQHPGIVFNRDMLLEHIWGYEYYGDTRTVDTHVQRLRRKLDWGERILTVYGVGYKFIL